MLTGPPVTIDGVSSIAPGESIIVLQLNNDLNATLEAADFEFFWGLGGSGVHVATFSSTGRSYGKADIVNIYDAVDMLVASQGYGLVDNEHAGVWAGGEEYDSANFIGGDNWVAGAAFDGQFGITSSVIANGDGNFEYGSPGFAVPTPGAAALDGLAGLAGFRRRRA